MRIYLASYLYGRETRSFHIVAATVAKAVQKSTQVVKNKWGDRLTEVREIIAETEVAK